MNLDYAGQPCICIIYIKIHISVYNMHEIFRCAVYKIASNLHEMSTRCCNPLAFHDLGPGTRSCGVAIYV